MSLTALDSTAGIPVDFQRALAAMRAVTPRPEIVLEEGPAPRRLAPHAATFLAEVAHQGLEMVTGRLVLLHDPDGQEGWDGTFRLVTYLRAELDPEMAADPLLVRVGWTWLTDALHAHGAAYRAPGGTVTRSASEGFGSLEANPATTEMELRASWTPADTECGAHLRAWCDTLATVAGLPPLPPGVTPLPGTTHGR